MELQCTISQQLSNRWIIEQDNDNKTRSVCFTCIAPLSIFINSCSTTVNSLPAIDTHERQRFNELRGTVVSRQVFIRSQSLIAR
jgi:hypothetical protein